jgi:signal transduction histidine kinase
MEMVENVLQGRKMNIEHFMALRKDGTTFPCMIHVKAVQRQKGLIRLQGFVIDISKAKKLEQELQENEARYRSLVENVGIGIALISPHMEILALNRQMKAWFPLIDETRRPLCYESYWSPPRNTICPDCPTCKTLTDGEVHEAVMSIPTGDSLKHYRIIASPIKDRGDNVRYAVEMVEDITERKALQDKLIRSERMAAIGQLAASIAHEINSPLQGIAALLSVIRKNYPEEPQLLRDLDLISEAFGNIRDIVKNLLDLNRRGKVQKQMINVNDVIEKTIALFAHHLSRNRIRAHLNLSLIIPEINASPQQLGQVFMNLFNNAVEAMQGTSHGKGEITVTTWLENDAIMISVADMGPGIPEKALDHIFDPFYTCKYIGTGMGLFICQDIIREHQGTILAENLPQGGAQFTITLPVNG